MALSAQTLEERVAAIAQESVVAQQGFWGAEVVDLATGDVLFRHDEQKLFLPASNAKLFTTALALMRLGPEHRMKTQILATSAPDGEGVVHGDLVFVGGGDPTLSGRDVPYSKTPRAADPLGPFRELAAKVLDAGIRRVEGDIVGDDTAYVWEPYPVGWAQEDLFWGYGAPMSALTLHDNAFRLSVLPASRTGEPARLILKPPEDYYAILNHVRTVASGTSRVMVDWPHGSREIHLWGAVRPRAGVVKYLAIRDPAEYAAWLLARYLKDNGVEVTGEPRAEHQWPREEAAAPAVAPSGTVLAERLSPPLFEILKIIDKESQNLHAELVLREVGRVVRGEGSLGAGLKELDTFLGEIGITPEEYRLEDASGLSRVDLASPAAFVKLLSSMYLSKERDGWLDLLAVGGEDGTLQYRFRETADRGHVMAKTGTLTGASALAGYVQTVSGKTLAFSIMVNNYDAPSRAGREFIDGVVGELLR